MGSVRWLLIVARSARMLAQAVRELDFLPLVIDQYADRDTLEYAEDYYQVASLAEQELAPAINYFIAHYPVRHVLYGSGFEYYPESLIYLGRRLVLMGNRPETFAKLLDKRFFFNALTALQIRYPPLSFEPPITVADWLLKPQRSLGGLGIMRFHFGQSCFDDYYWQQYLPGDVYSVFFLADGETAQIIGFNRQWTICLDEIQQFVFSGIVNFCDLSLSHRQELSVWLQALVPALGLIGLNSLDFIHVQGKSYVLEINARPPASMQLYSQRWLLDHIRGVVGLRGKQNLLSEFEVVRPRCLRGFQVVYAPYEITIPESFVWPVGCVDLPLAGTRCFAGQPICSILATAESMRVLTEQFALKQQFIISHLLRS